VDSHEDARSGNATVDYLGEPWAVPLQEARLSSFLAADRSNTADTGPEVLDAFLSGQIVDLQSLLNVNTLVDGTGKISDSQFHSFERLFELLGLPADQLQRLAENLVAAAQAAGANPMAPLWPQRVQDLVWLGLPLQTVAVLQPYISVLPIAPRSAEVKVNLNTAGPEVIYASIDGAGMADAQRLVAARERAPFRNTNEAKAAIGASDATFAESQAHIDVKSSFFEIRSRLRLDPLTVEERTVVRRDGTSVVVLDRERGPGELMAPAQAALKR
jgi:general secretion pathway protein K